MPESNEAHSLNYEPASEYQRFREALHFWRRIALGAGLGLLCLGVGSTISPSHSDPAFMMGVGAFIVGFALPALRR